MAGSILKEVTFTPQVFVGDVILTDMRKFERLINALEDIADSGIIVGISSSWMGTINDFIENYDENTKDEMQNVFKFLSSRNRIVIHPLKESTKHHEDEWIILADKLNHERTFDIIVSSKASKITCMIEAVDRKIFKNRGAIVQPQTRENMKLQLAPILAYAELVKVYDPYFNLTLPRYKEALDVICEELCSQHGMRESAIIDIHTSVKALLENNDTFNWSSVKRWQEELKTYARKYSHAITIHVWEDKRREDEWHDRWIITNQCGITLGKGSDISKWTDSTWGILDWDKIPNITRKFAQSREEYHYIGSITLDKVEKNSEPKNYRPYPSQEEIAKKLNNIKTLKPSSIKIKVSE